MDSTPGICLLTPALLDRDLLAGAISEALEHPSVEVVILTTATVKAAPGGLLRDLRGLAVRHGKVFLVEDDIELATKLEAEGTLMSDVSGIERTRKAIGDEAMVGVKCGISRHDAMEAGEAGADFVGLSAELVNDADLQKLSDHVTWWNDLFEIPSVAFGARTAESAMTLARSAPDFIALGDPFWSSPGAMVAIASAIMNDPGTE